MPTTATPARYWVVVELGDAGERRLALGVMVNTTSIAKARIAGRAEARNGHPLAHIARVTWCALAPDRYQEY